jgi:RNA polymerase sigma-54 factor
MALEIKQHLRLTQQLVITPQLQQAIKLLQLSQPELVELVDKELLENPLLEDGAQVPDTVPNEPPEMATDRGGAEPTLVSKESNESQEVGGKEGDMKNEPTDFDWDNYINTYNASEMGEGINRNFDDLPTYENTLATKTNLFDHLLWQMQLGNFDPDEVGVGTEILGGINDDGYFNDSLEEIAQRTDFPLDFVDLVLEKIQGFDPPGVGARNLKECLLLQVKNFENKHTDLIGEIIEHHLIELEKRDYPKIAKALKVSVEKIKNVAKLIHELEPKPGREYSTSEAQYITPDVYVRKFGEEWTVILNEDGLPKLKLNSLYKSMVEGKGSKETKEYVQDKLRSALWLIRSIHQRQRTLYKTARTIVKFQKDFFEKGINFLKPMILRDIANEIEMHESTVSRVTTNKYMHTPHGIFELKFFFNSGISTSQGESIASESIKSKIKGLIGHENPKKPLSDQEIVRSLKGVNIEIARRTVAKYREVLGILPSSKRRQLY